MNSRIWTLPLVLLCACGGETHEPSVDAGTVPETGGYVACAEDARVGALTVALRDGFTTVQGAVTNGVRPVDVPDVVMSEGGCELWRPKSLFCDPGCTGSTTCNDQGVCVELPSNQDIGTLTFTGLSESIELTARAPVYYYNYTGTLPHPGFNPGDSVSLQASGGSISPFSLVATGVGPLVVTTASVALQRDRPATLQWAALPQNDGVRLALELNIANHGGTPGRVVCELSDTGSFDIPAALVTALLDGGFSGFPTVSLIRQGVDSVDSDLGCVELHLLSEVVLPVSIPGLVSCSDSTDCPSGQTCQPDLTCG